MIILSRAIKKKIMNSAQLEPRFHKIIAPRPLECKIIIKETYL